MEKLTKDERRACLRRFSPVGRVIRLTGAFRAFKDGDGVSIVWRWWHPISWLMTVILFPVCAVVGERIAVAVPFRLSGYWRARREKIQWL
jgi:hypothetical protein